MDDEKPPKHLRKSIRSAAQRAAWEGDEARRAAYKARLLQRTKMPRSLRETMAWGNKGGLDPDFDE